jgi:thiamine-monophosphate kinase
LLALAREARVTLIGGNLARSPGPLMVDVTALGRAAKRRILTRGAGRPGHELYVTGSLGGAAAGLAMLEAGVNRAAASPDALACIQRYETPDARLRMGRVVGRSGAASAAIDLSDGLADAVRQLAEAAGTGAIVRADAVPVDPGARNWAVTEGQDPLAVALSGGEDYELLFAVPSRRRRAFLGATRRCSQLPVTKIGELTREPVLVLEAHGRRTPLPEPAFLHF